MSTLNVVASTPLLITAGAATTALAVGLLPGRLARRHGPSLVAIAGIVAAMVMSVVLWDDRLEAFGGGLRADRFSALMNLIFLSAGLLTILLAWREPAAVDRRGEYAALILISVTGMMLVAGAGDLITIFLGIEVLSVSLYVLCALEVWRERSLESGLKYLITGAVGASVLLYGLALLFGATGSTNLTVIGDALAGSSFTGEPLVVAAMVLIAGGLAFKASAAPFHMWTPDVYEGAPTPVTAFFAAAPKVAAIALLMRVALAGFAGIRPQWQQVITALAIASMGLGAFAAIGQTNIKRLLAYSAIGNIGYALIGLAAGSPEGARGVIIYMAIYVAMTLGTFACVLAMRRGDQLLEDIDELSGLAENNLSMAVVLAILMFSLAGIPPLAGFFAKFYVFVAAVKEGLWALAVIGVLASVVGAYYYVRIVKIMFFDEPREKFARIPVKAGVVMAVSALFTLLYVAWPAPLVDAAGAASKSLF